MKPLMCSWVAAPLDKLHAVVRPAIARSFVSRSIFLRAAVFTIIALVTFTLNVGLARADPLPLDLKSVWQTYSFVTSIHEKPITYMRAAWIVPKVPSQKVLQFLALWPGLESPDSKTILQPVLQYGNTANGTDKSWAISCWWVETAKTGYRAKNTAVILVEPGTKLTGVMELIAKKGRVSTYKCYFEGYPSSELIYETEKPLTAAWVDYETHAIYDCDDYSDGPVLFKDIEVRFEGAEKARKWYTGFNAITDPNKCGIKVRIVKDSVQDGEVSIGIDARFHKEFSLPYPVLPMLSEREKRSLQTSVGTILCPQSSPGSATVVVDETHILTAAHLVFDEKGRPREACSFRTSVNDGELISLDLTNVFPQANVTSWPKDDRFDVVTIALARPVRDATPLPFESTALPIDERNQAFIVSPEEHGPPKLTACTVSEQIPAMQGAPTSLFLACRSGPKTVGAPILRYDMGKIVIKGVVQTETQEPAASESPITRAIGIDGDLQKALGPT